MVIARTRNLKFLAPSLAIAFLAVANHSAFAVETQLVPEADVPPTVTVDQPADPAASKGDGPVLMSMSVRLAPQIGNIVPKTIIPEFHFRAPNGNAVLLHRDMIETSANNFHLNPSTAINISADAQKKGAVVTGGWSCGQAQYYATISAYIMASDGSRSNAVKYTVHCNGG